MIVVSIWRFASARADMPQSLTAQRFDWDKMARRRSLMCFIAHILEARRATQQQTASRPRRLLRMDACDVPTTTASSRPTDVFCFHVMHRKNQLRASADWHPVYAVGGWRHTICQLE
jgi:hypothetical protein